MAAVSELEFDEVEKKISEHSLRISLNLNEENGTEMTERMKHQDNLNDDRAVDKSSDSELNLWHKIQKKYTKYLRYFIIHVVVLIYLVFATLHWKSNNVNCTYEWCNGYGMFVILLVLTYITLCYFYIVKKYFGSSIKRFFKPSFSYLKSMKEKRYVGCTLKSAFYFILLIGLIAFLVYDTIGATDRLISCIGVCTMLVLGFIFSKHPRQINWRPVIWGLILQFTFGLIIIRWPIGRSIFQCLSNKVAMFLSYAQDGASFVFSKELVENKIFAFSALPVIFFFSFMVQILYYWGAMQWFILKLGWSLHTIMGTTVCESINSAANTFLGMTESPLLIKPYLSKLTSSEIHAIMCSGFASVSGTVLAAYISFGAQPSHLITASVMSAPAALCFSKLFYPETEKSLTTFKNIPLQKSEDTSVMDAATKGALAGIPLILGIVANIVAFVSFISFLNGILSWMGGLVGFADLTFEYILSKIFMPLSWIMGVPWDQCEEVATLIGLKTVVNEFVAYQKLGEFKRAGRLSPRVEGIATFAICGFANPGSIGIMMGGLASLAPEKREQIASVVIRAFLAGSAVCFMSASIAGMLINEDYYSRDLNATIINY